MPGGRRSTVTFSARHQRHCRPPNGPCRIAGRLDAVDDRPSRSLSNRNGWRLSSPPPAARPQLRPKKKPARDPPAPGCSASRQAALPSRGSSAGWARMRTSTMTPTTPPSPHSSIPSSTPTRSTPSSDSSPSSRRESTSPTSSRRKLLALGERIGTVNAGLSDDVLAKSLTRSIYMPTASGSHEDCDRKCSVCQEYLAGEEVGKMACKHYYHISCIQHWLRQKKWCPICKSVTLNTN